MTAELAVTALRNAVVDRRPVATVVHSDPRSVQVQRVRTNVGENKLRGSLGRVGACPYPANLATTPRWNRSSRSFRTTCSTPAAGEHAPSYGKQSPYGSRRPTTVADVNADSVDTPPSALRDCTRPPHRRPEPPTPTVSKTLGRPDRAFVDVESRTRYVQHRRVCRWERVDRRPARSATPPPSAGDV